MVYYLKFSVVVLTDVLFVALIYPLTDASDVLSQRVLSVRMLHIAS